MGNRGASLATTLVFSALALVVALAMSSTSVMHLHFANSQSHARRAHSAAESALALALERVTKRTDFGGSGEEVTVNFGEASGRVSFASTELEGYSTNNRLSEVSVQGWNGAVVPANSLHLVAIGRSGHSRRGIEMVVHVPEFPYALASSGPIASRGSLLVGGLEKIEDAFPLDSGALLPSDLASNARGESVRLEGEAEITGDIETVGSIFLGEDVQVHGQLKSFSAPVPVARVDLQALRPDSSLPLAEGDTSNLSGAYHASQSHLVLGNGLTMDDGILYVNGDLTIRGGLQGRGALLVNGTVTIHDGAALASESQIALVATDTVTITGTDQGSSFFQGLVYTEGDLVAEDITLMGAFVANREQSALDPGSRLSLENVTAIHVPDYSGFETESKSIVFQFPLENDGTRLFDGVFTLEATEEQWGQLLDFALHGDENEKSTIHLETIRKLKELGFLKSNPQFRANHRDNDDARLVKLARALRRAERRDDGGGGLQIIEQQPSFRFDLNEFLSETSRSRVILHREF